MIIAYIPQTTFCTLIIDTTNYQRLKEALWVDIFSPTEEEIASIETVLGIMVPTRAAMQEIEISSRLYTLHHTLYMTATLIAGSTSSQPKNDSVTFILTSSHLLTLRYIEPKPFALFSDQIRQMKLQNYTSTILLIHLLEVTIDRLADILEMVGFNLEQYSTRVFQKIEGTIPHLSTLTYMNLMQEIGRHANLSGKARESLLTFNRLISFFTQSHELALDKASQARLDTLNRDIQSLSDYTTFMTAKINFLLDATLGMVNIEQNNIIKIFSVAAVIFLPPTLIASIYGMNFPGIPELSWKYGYGFAVILMVGSAILTYQLFKRKKWL